MEERCEIVFYVRAAEQWLNLNSQTESVQEPMGRRVAGALQPTDAVAAASHQRSVLSCASFYSELIYLLN